jgi:outer membrane immunogenic protein
MKKLFISVAAFALTAGAALAADLPSRKAAPILPPPPPPPPMWTGFYAGLNIGGNVGTNSNTANVSYGPSAINYDSTYYMDQSSVGLSQSGSLRNTQSGVIGGGQIGYNYQLDRFVVGIEADIQGAAIKGSSYGNGAAVNSVLWDNDARYPMTTTSAGGTSVNAGVNWMGTLRGRIGYLVTPTLLAYGTGGLTYGGAYANVRNISFASTTGAYLAPDPQAGRVDTIGTQAFFGGGNRSQTLVGWNVGGGLEWMFWPNWSVKAEAIYWNMGSMNIQTTSFANAMAPDPNGWITNNLPTSAIFGSSRVNYQGVIARAGVNYHFNWGAAAPVVAKY